LKKNGSPACLHWRRIEITQLVHWTRVRAAFTADNNAINAAQVKPAQVFQQRVN